MSTTVRTFSRKKKPDAEITDRAAWDEIFQPHLSALPISPLQPSPPIPHPRKIIDDDQESGTSSPQTPPSEIAPRRSSLRRSVSTGTVSPSRRRDVGLARRPPPRPPHQSKKARRSSAVSSGSSSESDDMSRSSEGASDSESSDAAPGSPPRGANTCSQPAPTTISRGASTSALTSAGAATASQSQGPRAKKECPRGGRMRQLTLMACASPPGMGPGRPSLGLSPLPPPTSEAALLSPTALRKAAPRTSRPAPAKSSATARGGGAADHQLSLDLGQRGLHESVTCPVCGMVYLPGAGVDAALHQRFHKRFLTGIDFPAEEIREVVDIELGFAPGARPFVDQDEEERTPGPHHPALEAPPQRPDCKPRRKVVGAALIERIAEGFPPVPQPSGVPPAPSAGPLEEPAAAPKTPILRASGDPPPMVVEQRTPLAATARPARPALPVPRDQPRPALLGVSRVWVHKDHRRAAIATRLLDAARAHFIYGYPAAKEQVAFSQPTPMGRAFATRYLGPGFLVYN
ncbi:putative N-acetyltransferase ESCO1 [Paratrimastix pyriformis]|uniref:N-acetyltransferase ESCO1 n=1 Tax=Paratrimastix pyriformis TaxID=342808 RepID=A0ABQ8UW27_9EUKA|nr:putative N-acetyltransferase ESCO1 [Paratrimastix pyriformis]